MEAYLDNSATTACSEKAAEMVMQVLTKDYGNPSSLHNKGIEGENFVRDARRIIAKTLKVKEKEIYFTSGGTESNNLAIVGYAMANQRAGKHIISTPFEHPSVGNPLAFLEEQGFEVSYLHVDRQGHIEIKELEDLIREDTILVSMMHVNNEIGVVLPIEEAGKVIKAKNPKCAFHVDAIQSYGKFKILPERIGVDMLSVSGHKIHGPKGSGFLYVNGKIKIKPEILGGGQEWGLRSGTQNTPAIAGLGVAAAEMYDHLEENREHLFQLRDHFIEEVTKIDGVSVNGPLGHDAAPQIVSVSVQSVRAEVLLHALEDKEIYVSAGSACSSNKPSISKTLQAIHLDPNLLDSTVRFSFSVHTTMEEIDYALDAMRTLIPMLQRFTRH
jgi:cysteine desulfurase